MTFLSCCLPCRPTHRHACPFGGDVWDGPVFVACFDGTPESCKGSQPHVLSWPGTREISSAASMAVLTDLLVASPPPRPHLQTRSPLQKQTNQEHQKPLKIPCRMRAYATIVCRWPWEKSEGRGWGGGGVSCPCGRRCPTSVPFSPAPASRASVTAQVPSALMRTAITAQTGRQGETLLRECHACYRLIHFQEFTINMQIL